MTRKATGWEKILVKDMSVQGLLCRFIVCNKCATLAQEGKAMHLWSQGIHGGSLYFPFNFAMNPKLL